MIFSTWRSIVLLWVRWWEDRSLIWWYRMQAALWFNSTVNCVQYLLFWLAFECRRVVTSYSISCDDKSVISCLSNILYMCVSVHVAFLLSYRMKVCNDHALLAKVNLSISAHRKCISASDSETFPRHALDETFICDVHKISFDTW